MKHLLVLLLCAFTLGCSPKPLSKVAFEDSYAAEVIAKAGRATKVTRKGDLELEITTPSGEKLTAFLDNAYNEYQQDPSALTQILGRYVDGLLDPENTTSTTDRSRIIPVIKDRQWIAEVNQSLKARGKEPIEHVYEHLNEELLVLYAEDSPQNIRYLTPDTLREAGVAREELRALAIENLNRLLPSIELHRGDSVSQISAGGDYDASLLLIAGIWRPETLEVSGEIVVAVPARDRLLVTGSQSRKGLADLQAAAIKIRQEASYSLTDELFVYRNGKFIPFGRVPPNPSIERTSPGKPGAASHVKR